MKLRYEGNIYIVFFYGDLKLICVIGDFVSIPKKNGQAGQFIGGHL